MQSDKVLCHSCSLEISLLHILNKKQVVCLGCGSDINKCSQPFNDTVCLGQARAYVREVEAQRSQRCQV